MRRFKPSRLLYLSLMCALLSLPALAQDQAKVDLFSPQGVVKGVRQVTARFSEPMVPFGDFRLQDPFVVSCPVAGKGRWVDQQNWAYDFPQDLPGGIRGTFTLRKGLKTLAGRPVGGRQAFSFSTGGPAIVKRLLPGWTRVDEHQVFVLVLDAEPTEESLLKNVHFAVEGIREKVGITILKGKDREQVLKGLQGRPADRPVLVIQARQAFPSGSKVNLVWGAGVASKSGVATTAARVERFETRQPFTARFSCEREKADCGCIPVLPMTVSFSSPVSRAQVARVTLRDASGKVYKPVLGSEHQGGVSRVTFSNPFPEKTWFTLDIPRDMQDVEGRPLSNRSAFPMKVSTHGYPPLAKFSSRFGVIESADPVLPVTVRNIETGAPGSAPTGVQGTKNLRLFRIPPDQETRIIQWLVAAFTADREKSLLKPIGSWAQERALPRRGAEKDFEVVGIPLSGPGLHIAEVESSILGQRLLAKKTPMYVHTAALVTNMAAHFKQGRESSLVWVTTLDRGKPVAGANVTIRACDGTPLWQGKTDDLGIARVPAVDFSAYSGRCGHDYAYGLNSGVFIFARTESDMTFTHSGWNDGIESWRFNLPSGNVPTEGRTIARTVLDRPLFRAGETVHMKHILRLHTTQGFSPAQQEDLPTEAKIVHGGSEQEYRLPLAWSKNGSASMDWKIPEDARLGTYRIFLAGRAGGPSTRSHEDWGAASTASFSVEEFRVPLMRGVIIPPAGPLVNPKAVPVGVSLSYLSGGGASGAQVKLRGEIRSMFVTFKGYEDFSFRAGSIRTGLQGTFTGMGDVGYYEEYDGDGGGGPSQKAKPSLKTISLNLDRTGNGSARWEDLPKLETPSTLHAELEYLDGNGQAQTSGATIPLYPASLAVGIKPSSWAISKKDLSYQVVVLDLKGRPVKNARVSVDLFQEITHTHRARLVGGFYSYQNTTEIRKVGRHFTGTTDSHGLVTASGPSPVSGSITLHAEVADPSGNIATSNASVWVAGSDSWWFPQGNDDRIDVLPEKRLYEPGEKARFQVRMPFREAVALVSVEREGIIDTFVRTVSSLSPVIEIPVKKNYAPNAYVSVLVVRGRTTDARPTSTFDPGRPAYKLGVSEIQVGWKPYSLAVEVVPDKTVYRVRGKMDVRIRVRDADNGPPKHAEVAVAAVDEGLLELKPNDTWNLLPGMMVRRPYEVSTSTAQSMVVGKRHFGLKALPHGGGGGRQITRELFDTLLFWKAVVPLDPSGEARVSIPINDSLTSFRIVAVATAGFDAFGTGEASVRTTQDLMVLPGIPPLVHTGDSFNAMVTVRNTTSRAMNARLRLTRTLGKTSRAFDPVTVALGPSEAREVSWKVETPLEEGIATYEVEADTPDATDRVRVTQRVAPSVPVRTFQATLAQVDQASRIPVARPADALPGMGGIGVTLSPTLTAGLEGVREYMSGYPYVCLEQQTSKAVALKDKAMWQDITRRLPEYIDTDGLLKFFPSCRYGSDILTAYVLSISHQAGFGIPAYLKDRMVSGLEGFVDGSIRHQYPVGAPDLTIRKIAALEALSRYQAIEPARLASVDIQPNFLPTSAVVDWLLVLYRSTALPDRDRRYAEAQQVIRSRLNLQGSTMGFSREDHEAFWWLMSTGDSTALKAIIALLPSRTWDADMGRIMRGAMGRMKRGRWDTTVANAWGTLAVDAFAARFEKEPVTGATRVAGWGEEKAVTWPLAKGAGEMLLPWPEKQDTVALTHTGTGAPWALTRSLAAIPLRKPVSTGYTVKKTMTPVEQKTKGVWSRGDIVRVRLEMAAQADMTWVVVNDPIPGGATIVHTGLGSALAASGEKDRSATYIERKFEAFRAYYEYIGKGGWAVEYTLRLNNPGLFTLPPTRVEALYAPEMLGELPNSPIEVRE
ncbi:MAG TPA: MG2 domain-containing protein [Deltaproteobacteria bacterium]|nr:MG2 domain-containing protein [Deltaproteobacteria bacterium]